MAQYQYETSPRKLEPEYQRKKTSSKKSNQGNKNQNKKPAKNKQKKKFKLSFEMKFFINSMLFFSIIFAIIACQALVEQRYKERESLKQEYNELLASSNIASDVNKNIRAVASDYGMQTKSATLINLETSDYIETSTNEVETKEEGIFSQFINWLKNLF